MTIEKGQAWGEPVSARADNPVAASDREVALLAAQAFARGEHPILELDPGGAGRSDIARTLGVERRRDEPDRLGYPFDLGFASLDEGEPIPFVAHLLARHRLWSGEFAVVMNGGWVDDWYLGPRAHPNDGLVDITVGALGLRQRLLARRRLRTGSHLPHPGLTLSRRPTWSHRFERPVTVFTDGDEVGRTTAIRAWVEADCFTLIV